MTQQNPTQHSAPHIDLQAAAKESMLRQGFQPDFSPAVEQQIAQIKAQPPQLAPTEGIRDLRSLPWSTIDNDTSRDLAQIEVAERLQNGDARVRIAIADVDSFVPKNSPVDQHAAQQTTSVYTGVRIFPMLPEQLSTDITSLLENGDKL